MRLATLRLDAATTAAVASGPDWIGLDAPDIGDLLATPGWRSAAEAALADAARPRIAGAGARLAAPVPRPGKILCCGLNYLDHIVETGRERPTYPTLFTKFADTLTGPADDIPIDADHRADWEAELTVVIGATVRRADRAAARAAIAGYTIANDVSMRDWQYRTLQWDQGKAWDATTPLGPVVVTADELDPADGLAISCELDGETVQSSSTDQLIFDCAELVRYVSTFATLRPGDLILTGTTGGVGHARDPQRFLRDGEVLTTRIEGIGELRNVIRVRS